MKTIIIRAKNNGINGQIVDYSPLNSKSPYIFGFFGPFGPIFIISPITFRLSTSTPGLSFPQRNNAEKDCHQQKNAKEKNGNSSHQKDCFRLRRKRIREK